MALAASLLLHPTQTLPKLQSSRSSRKGPPTRRSNPTVARLFGPAIFESSKLKVLHVGVDQGKYPGLPRAYTLTHSDITSMLTLAISNTINSAQLKSWCNRVQRDEVVAEWRMIKGAMSLHAHCHISGGHFLLDLVASLRYYIFSKELPVRLCTEIRICSAATRSWRRHPSGSTSTLTFQSSIGWSHGVPSGTPPPPDCSLMPPMSHLRRLGRKGARRSAIVASRLIAWSRGPIMSYRWTVSTSPDSINTKDECSIISL